MAPQDATVHPLTSARCLRSCQFRGRTRAHHDRLLRVVWDHAELLDLMELAVTWGELEYAESRIVPPQRWLDFAAAHRWADADEAERILSMAADVALRVRRTSHPAERPALVAH